MFGGVLAGGRPLKGLGLILLTDEDDRRSPSPWFGIFPTGELTLNKQSALGFTIVYLNFNDTNTK